MKRWVFTVLITVFAAIFLLSAFFLVRYAADCVQHRKQTQELAAMVQAVPEPTEAEPAASEPEDTGAQILPEYAALYALNEDMVGWICIDGTNINYPVMQSPDRTDFYLDHDFYGSTSSHGCIYVREQCDVQAPSDNVTVYGHRMRDGSMFKDLVGYCKESYFLQHRYITFNTLTACHSYEVLAVFKTVANDSGFAYHLFVDASEPEEFEAYIARCKELALYDTGVEAAYGDKLITLSTCDSSRTDGRLVVVAKRIA